MSTRTIEVFSAGCPLCNETLKLIREAVRACGCEVFERRCEGDERCEPAKRYDIGKLPSVVVDGAIVFEGRVTPDQAALLKR